MEPTEIISYWWFGDTVLFKHLNKNINNNILLDVDFNLHQHA